MHDPGVSLLYICGDSMIKKMKNGLFITHLSVAFILEDDGASASPPTTASAESSSADCCGGIC